MPHSRIASLLETLTGRGCSRSQAFNRLTLYSEKLNWGLSQFNEILLLLGLARVNKPFFTFLFNGKDTIATIYDLEAGVCRLVAVALLLYGNIREAFETLSKEESELDKIIENGKPIDISNFASRHEPILKIEKISADKTYYLGYLIEREIKERLERNPADPKANEENKIREGIVEQGKRNQDAYLACDHMDVYVATSMREKHEFLLVSRIADEIFSHHNITDLKLRHFDPTQAYCKNRIDKGLSEGLMLKRATCTIYLAQESDTLGKDSELASTLAQGKPVIAYVPDGSETYVLKLLDDLRQVHPDKSKRDLILDQLRIFDPKLAWENPNILNQDEGTLLDLLKKTVKTSYDKRADSLAEKHPLGIQVNLANGVANGVLVVRSIEQCVKLLRAIVTRTLEFDLIPMDDEGQRGWQLRERISKCVFRTITPNGSLSNTFWNYYFE